MTSKRNLERRLDQLDPGHEEHIFVVSIEGDDEHGQWFTHEEYKQAFGEYPESEFTYQIEGVNV